MIKDFKKQTSFKNKQTPRYIPQRTENIFKQKAGRRTFIAVVLIIAKGGNNPNVYQQMNG